MVETTTKTTGKGIVDGQQPMTTSAKRRKPSKHSRNNQLKAILNPFDRQVGKLADELLVEEFVAVVLNGLETGSYEEALAEELVERFQAVLGIE